MTRFNRPLTAVIGSIGTLAFSTVFSACVPTEPPAPATETRLNFATATADGTGEVLKFWSATTQQTNETAITSDTNMGIIPLSGQPDGPTLLYRVGSYSIVDNFSSYYTAAENAAGQYVRKTVIPLTNETLAAPQWSSDGSHLAWNQREEVRVLAIGGASKRFAQSGFFKWSPQGNKIVYSNVTAGVITARVHDAATGTDTEVFRSAQEAPPNVYPTFTWLSDNRHVVVSTSSHFIVDTTTPAPTVHQEIGVNEGGIIPSPSGDRFVLISGEPYVTSTRSYTLAFADGRAPVALADAYGQTAPSWSASGDHLYIVTDVGTDGILDVIRSDADGQIQQTIATGMPAQRYGDGDSYTAVYNSPKNDKFAFIHVNSDADTIRLTVVDLPSGNIHGFNAIAGIGIEASWSPNGRYLAWGTPDQDQYLYDSNSPDAVSKLMNVDGNRLGLRLKPWSRDSKHIAACRQSGYYTCQISVISVNAGNITYTALPDIAGNNLVWTGK